MGEILDLRGARVPLLTDIAYGKLLGSTSKSDEGYSTWAQVLALPLAQVNNWQRQQYFGTKTLVDGANIPWDLDLQQVAKVTLGGNRTLDNPTNMKDGATYIVRVSQDGAGSRALGFGSAYDWGDAGPPALSVGPNKMDVLTFVSDGATMFGVPSLGFN